ncbi:hypothetical protein [Halorubrum sp. SD612]|uniref:hypothetical protein n=1 Tax=Halorubrum sp. SD612 TaxID=1855863 RepID=UPI001E36B694|nr:hypothetical protein [Halorubrum sp. SD612]
MTDWERVRQELKEAGYSGFEFDSGDTAVPGLSGEWVSGNLPREGGLKHENQPLWIRILDALPGVILWKPTRKMPRKAYATSPLNTGWKS